jgi:hypothetical protein
MQKRAKSCMIALGLVSLVSASAMTPSLAAPISNAAALRATMSGDITQVRERGRRGWRRGYGSFSRAYNYSRGYGYGGTRNCYGCLGGRDGDGVPCRC